MGDGQTSDPAPTAEEESNDNVYSSIRDNEWRERSRNSSFSTRLVGSIKGIDKVSKGRMEEFASWIIL